MTQYASSDYDSKSEASLQSSNKISKYSSSGDIEKKPNKVTGYDLPFEINSPRNRSSGNTSTVNSSKYNQTPSNNSLVKAGKRVMNH